MRRRLWDIKSRHLYFYWCNKEKMVCWWRASAELHGTFSSSLLHARLCVYIAIMNDQLASISCFDYCPRLQARAQSRITNQGYYDVWGHARSSSQSQTRKHTSNPGLSEIKGLLSPVAKGLMLSWKCEETVNGQVCWRFSRRRISCLKCFSITEENVRATMQCKTIPSCSRPTHTHNQNILQNEQI